MDDEKGEERFFFGNGMERKRKGEEIDEAKISGPVPNNSYLFLISP